MLDYLIFCATVIIFLILAVIYLYPGAKKWTTIPGPQPVDPMEGNIPDIISSGSLHEFLERVHEEYGPIVSFWYGPKMCVSICTPELFEEHSAPFDRPGELFENLVPLITDRSLQLANGADGRRRHACYSKCYTPSAVKAHYDIYNRFAHELVARWIEWTTEEYIPIQSEMFNFALKSILLASFGQEFKSEDKCRQMHKCYNICFAELDKQIKSGNAHSSRDALKLFEQKKEEMYGLMRDAVRERKERGGREKGEQCLLIDAAIELELDEQTLLADLLTVFIAGFHTTAFLLTWSIYYLSENVEVQEKLRQEVLEHVGMSDFITQTMTDKLTYMQMVLNESLRAGRMAPYAARVQSFETTLGGHKIPAGTPVVHALGVSHHNTELFPHPNKFDPERFRDIKTLPARGFEPFGFAGKRKCPGYQFSLHEAMVLLSHLVRSFSLTLAPSTSSLQTMFTLVGKPADEVWVLAKPYQPPASAGKAAAS